MKENLFLKKTQSTHIFEDIDQKLRVLDQIHLILQHEGQVMQHLDNHIPIDLPVQTHLDQIQDLGEVDRDLPLPRRACSN